MQPNEVQWSIFIYLQRVWVHAFMCVACPMVNFYRSLVHVYICMHACTYVCVPNGQFLSIFSARVCVYACMHLSRQSHFYSIQRYCLKQGQQRKENHYNRSLCIRAQ